MEEGNRAHDILMPRAISPLRIFQPKAPVSLSMALDEVARDKVGGLEANSFLASCRVPILAVAGPSYDIPGELVPGVSPGQKR
jgi:hypothetical protein